jgi:hypothetical protein
MVKTTTTKHTSFKEFALRPQSAATIAILATACSDLQRSNGHLAQAFAAMKETPENPKFRGDAIYAIRMAIGHFVEALDIIGLIKKDDYVMSVLNRCDPQTIAEFEDFAEFEPDKLMERVRNALAFHYRDSGKLYIRAIQRLAVADGTIKRVRANHTGDWHWKFADDIVETVLATGATGKAQDNASLRLVDDEIGKQIGIISDAAKKFLSFSGELIWAFK